MADIATLTVRVTAAVEQFEQQMTRMEKVADTAFKKMEGSSSTLNIALGNLAAKGIAAVVSKATEMVGEVFQMSDSLLRLEAQTGISTDRLQSMAFAADDLNVPFETVTNAIEKFNVLLAKGKSDEFAAGLKAIGLSANELKALKPEEQFSKITEEVAKYNSKADQAAILTTLFGKSGADLVPLVGTFAELEHAAAQLGITIDRDTLQAADDFDQQMKVLWATIRADLLPVLKDLLPILSDLIKFVKEASVSWKEINSAAEAFDKSAIKARIAILEFARGVLLVNREVPIFGDAFGRTSAALEKVEGLLVSSRIELIKFGQAASTLPPVAPAVAVKPSLSLDPNWLKTEKTKTVKLLENALGTWFLNITAPVTISPTRISPTTDIIPFALGESEQARQRVIEEVSKWYDLRGVHVPLFLPPPDIKAAPADIAGINKELADKAAAATAKIWEQRGEEIGNAIIRGLQAKTGKIDAVLRGLGATVGRQLGEEAGAQFGPALVAVASKAFGPKLGQALGGTLSAILPGLGAIAGEALGGLFGKLFGPSQASQTRDMRNAFLEAAGGLEELKQRAAGSAEALEALGRLQSARKVKDFEKAQKDLTAAIEKQEQALKKLGDALAKASKEGSLLGPKLLADISKIDPKGAGGAAVFEFFQAQTERAMKGIETFVNNARITSQSSATAITASMGAIFEDLRLQGLTASEALTRMGPAILTVSQQLQAAGLTGGAAFQQLSLQAQFASDTIAGPLFTAAAGIGDLLVGLGNTGRLNEEIFLGLTKQITETWHEIEKTGKGGAAGLQLLQKPLQTVYELWQDQGFAIDETTEGLLRFAMEQGIVGDQFRSTQDKMILAIEKLVERIDKLVDKFADDMPAGAEAGARGVEDALGSIRVPRIEVPVSFKYDEFRPPAASGASTVAGSAVIDNNISIQVDGAEIARVAARNTGRVLAPYGV